MAENPGLALRIRTDGGSRGNPGPAGIGVVIEHAGDGSVVDELAEFIGRATNNVAEYRALIAGLRRAAELGAASVEVVSDSELMVRQITGLYQVRDGGLRPLFTEARQLFRSFPGGYRIEHTLRGGNKRADQLANRAIDQGTRAAGAPVAAGPARKPTTSPESTPVNCFALARSLAAGDVREVGGGLRVVRLRPGEPHSARWTMVLCGQIRWGSQTLEAGQCCAGPYEAGDNAAVLEAAGAT